MSSSSFPSSNCRLPSPLSPKPPSCFQIETRLERLALVVFRPSPPLGGIFSFFIFASFFLFVCSCRLLPPSGRWRGETLSLLPLGPIWLPYVSDSPSQPAWEDTARRRAIRDDGVICGRHSLLIDLPFQFFTSSTNLGSLSQAKDQEQYHLLGPWSNAYSFVYPYGVC